MTGRIHGRWQGPGGGRGGRGPGRGGWQQADLPPVTDAAVVPSYTLFAADTVATDTLAGVIAAVVSAELETNT